MKPFADLSDRGQHRRLRGMVMAALEHHDLNIVQIKAVHYLNNAIFRLTDRDGQSYLARVNRPGFHTEENIRSEALWLESLTRETSILTPQVVRTVDGHEAVRVTAPGVPESRTVILYRWISGRMTNRLTPTYLHKVGRAMATLHTHGISWPKPRGFSRKTWEVNMMLFGEPWTDKDGIHRLLTKREYAVFEQVADLFREAGDQLGTGDDVYGLIHSDLHSGNFMSHRGNIAIIDFDDCGAGHFLYDLSVTLSTLLTRPTYADLRAALLAGYRSVLDFPESHERYLGCMVGMRWIMIAMWKAGTEIPSAVKMDAELFARGRLEAIRDRSLHKRGTTV